MSKCITKYFLVSLPLIILFISACHSSLSNIDGLQVSNHFAAINDIRQRLKSGENGVMVIAHRACWRLAPENSIQAIEECIRLGVDMVEIDIRRTHDGHLVLMHDKSVDRTTNGSGLVADLTLAQIKRLKLKEFDAGKGAMLTKYTVPTLQQALNVAKGKILLNLDAKDDVRVQAVYESKKVGVENQVLLKKSLSSPAELKKEDSIFIDDVFFMPIVRDKNGDLFKQISSFSDIDPIAFEVIYQHEKSLLRACQAASSQQARCWVNSMWERLAPGHSEEKHLANMDKHWAHLVNLGVNMFQTDSPQALINYLESEGLR